MDYTLPEQSPMEIIITRPGIATKRLSALQIQITAQNIATPVNGKSVYLQPYSTAAMAAGDKSVAADFVAATAKPVLGWKCAFDGDLKFMPASCRLLNTAL